MPELHRRGADDGRVLASGELLFGERPVSAAHRAVVDEDLDAGASQRVRDLLGLRSTLDEDEALLAAGELPDARRGLADVGAEIQAKVAVCLRTRRIDQPERSLARALEPLADDLRVADGGREADALNVAAAHRDQALEQAREVRSAIVGGERVHLVDDDGGEAFEDGARVGAGADHHDLERLGRGHQNVRRRLAEALLARVAHVAVPLEDLEPDHPRVRLKPLLLVVEERANRADVEHRDGLEVLRQDAREQREDRGFRLPAGGRRQHDGVAAVEDRVDCRAPERAEASATPGRGRWRAADADGGARSQPCSIRPGACSASRLGSGSSAISSSATSIERPCFAASSSGVSFPSSSSRR